MIGKTLETIWDGIMKRWEINGKIMGNNWDDNGIGMGNTQRFTKASLGLLFSRSGVKQGKLDRTRSAKKCMKKDLM